ncbi:SGNH/GDSL hydrolase family protein [Caulobacter sp. RL271]|uniref:SGNH/GDSL hydrolase family protein n=1 Tax=Caulobacter segnis TaxID=88688 RepID=A0ABY4ZXE9_9CAUL|nr:SGNH/GDSL hydrolase family protein [Caulobacter segnis]USQ97228.1 SGNH/GDSL hydrolase family protein [Caulobacter segnis]
MSTKLRRLAAMMLHVLLVAVIGFAPVTEAFAQNSAVGIAGKAYKDAQLANTSAGISAAGGALTSDVGFVALPNLYSPQADALAEWIANMSISTMVQPNLFSGPPQVWLGGGTYTLNSDVSARIVSDGTGAAGVYKKIRVVPGSAYKVQFKVVGAASQTSVRAGAATTGAELFSRAVNAGDNVTYTNAFTPSTPDIYLNFGFGSSGADLTISEVVLTQTSVRPALLEWGNSIEAATGATIVANGYPGRLAAKFTPTRLSFPKGNGGDISTQILTRVTSQGSGLYPGNIHILGMLENDPANGVTAATTKANIATAITLLGPHYFIRSGLPNCVDSAAALNAQIVQLNADLKTLYGRRFIDINSALAAANDGSPGDLSDIAKGWTPRSLRFDAIHLNDAGYQVVADTIYAAIGRQ